MVDKASNVAADVRVSRIEAIDPKAPNLTSSEISFLTQLAVTIANLLASVINDAFVLIDRFSGEHTPPVEFRTFSADLGNVEPVVVMQAALLHRGNRTPSLRL